MNREEIEKLLGGYATGTLTAEEQEALFAAALEDQQLFEALAREEPLRELLQEPFAKSRLLNALERTPETRYWRWLRPAAWAIPAVGLAAVAVFFILQRPAARRPVTIAEVVRPHAEPALPVPSPLPQVLEKRPLPGRARLDEARPAEPLVAAAPPPPAAAPAAPPPPKDVQPPQADAALLGAQQAGAVPPAPSPAPRVSSLRMAEALQVQAAAGQQGQQAGVGGYVPSPDARALYYGSPFPPVFQTNLVERDRRNRPATTPVAPAATAPAALAMQHLGLRYSILRRDANGQVAALNPNEPIEPGGAISLQIQPNETGHLYVFEHAAGAWRLFASSRIERSTTYNVPQTGALSFEGSNPKELFVVFSRQPQQTPYPVPEARLDQLMSGNFTDAATYVVSTATIVPAQILAFPITLTQK